MRFYADLYRFVSPSRSNHHHNFIFGGFCIFFRSFFTEISPKTPFWEIISESQIHFSERTVNSYKSLKNAPTRVSVLNKVSYFSLFSSFVGKFSCPSIARIKEIRGIRVQTNLSVSILSQAEGLTNAQEFAASHAQDAGAGEIGKGVGEFLSIEADRVLFDHAAGFSAAFDDTAIGENVQEGLAGLQAVCGDVGGDVPLLEDAHKGRLCFLGCLFVMVN
jgi:hypothetical protein